jgi:putative OPT family oligopeptide transporter
MKQGVSESSMLEFTLKSVLTGTLFGGLFGAANAYLGLRVGLTVSTAIPISVLSIAVFRLGRGLWGPSTLLETNMSQTIGSASSSVASGVIFTMPALFLWGLTPTWLQIGVLGLMGGILGTLAMVPLRRILIVDAHDELPFPEGTACAEVLRATETGLNSSRWIFIGLGIGILIKLVFGLAALFPSELGFNVSFFSKAHFALEVSPALIAVGYILGFRNASVMFAGALSSWFVIIPLISHVGAALTVPLFPETKLLIGQMAPDQIWRAYVRYIGAGTVAAAGIITVFRTFPTMMASVKRIWESARRQGLGAGAGVERTDRDISGKIIIAGVVGVVLVLAAVPGVLMGDLGLLGRLVSALGVAVFGILFVAVSARIVGLVGVSSNPTSGMTIVTLLGTSTVFAFLGWNDMAARAAILTVGSVVAIAASISGDTAQDLKTGYLVGATPERQQWGQLIGVATACWAVAGTMVLLSATYGFGSKELPAPQATLMKTVIDGVLTGQLPWNLVLSGGSLGLLAILAGLPGLPFALGTYIPLATTSAIFCGGLIRRKMSSTNEIREDDPGVLCAAGLIAGEGFAGLAIAGTAALFGKKASGAVLGGLLGESASLLILVGIIALVWTAGARKK